jgi:DNA-binding SARP family transcriptional activator
LRRAIEPDLPERFPSRYLRVEEGRIALVLPTDSEVDFEVFENLITQAKWESALAIYHGDFLPEYRYADWCTAQREWLRQDYQTALLAMARQWIAEGRFRESLDACRKVLAIEPWQEEAVLIGMQALVGLGNITSALRLYQTLEKSLREDLGVEPQAELQAYYQALLNK